MLKFACILLGEDYSILKSQTPKSKQKIMGLASAMMIPILIWFMIGGATSYFFFDAGVYISIISALICSFLIWQVERIINLSDGDKMLRNFRIALGLVIALLGGIFVDEIIFKEDILQQKKEISKAKITAENKKAIVDAKEQKEKYIKEAKETRLRRADALMGKDASGQKGNGNISKSFENQAKNLQNLADSKDEEIINLRNNLDQKIKTERLAIENGKGSSALLMNVEALFQLVFQNPCAFFLFFLITVTLVLFEFLVVIVKMKGKTTSYDRYLEMQEQIGEKRYKELIQKFNPAHESVEHKALEDLLKSNINETRVSLN